MKTRIMFICTGNACRSQMAEGFARRYGGGDVEVFSAGVIAAGVNRCAIEAMRDIGIDISKQTSDRIDDALLQTMDVVVTVCDNAKQSCPAAPGAKKVLHWSIEDPIDAMGTLREKEVFAKTRDDIGRRVKALIASLGVSPPL